MRKLLIVTLLLSVLGFALVNCSSKPPPEGALWDQAVWDQAEWR